MNLSRIQRSFRRLTFLTLFTPIYAFSQSPGGVSGQQFWYSTNDSSGLISNYHSVDLLKLGAYAQDSILNIPVSSSLFFVLKGNFATAVEDTLLQIGDVTLIDQGIYHGRGFSPIDFTDSTSKIVSVQTIRGHRMAKDSAPEVNIGNLSKFNVAEVIYYPYYLDRAQRRMVNSYLSIKYAIPILQGIEPDWKDYWAKDSTHYWDANKDRAFYVRVMGLGADSKQSFYQTQSIAETGGHFKIALDSPAVAGSMPRTWMAQEGFVIFAQRTFRPSSMNEYCIEVRQGKNPLALWKFKATDQWRTWATHLLIETEKPLGTIADSIFFTDGTHYYYAPWVYQDSKIIRYEVDLSKVQTGKNYMFTKRSSRDQHCNSIVSFNDSGISLTGGSGMVSVHSFETGTLLETDLSFDRNIPLGNGQYYVVVTDARGHETFSELVAVRSKAPQSKHDVTSPSLKMYPNPVLSGAAVTLELQHFNEAPKTWQLVDALGRIIQQRPLSGTERNVLFTAPKMAGTYTLRVLTPDGVYSLKLICAQR